MSWTYLIVFHQYHHPPYKYVFVKIMASQCTKLSNWQWYLWSGPNCIMGNFSIYLYDYGTATGTIITDFMPSRGQSLGPHQDHQCLWIEVASTVQILVIAYTQIIQVKTDYICMLLKLQDYTWVKNHWLTGLVTIKTWIWLKSQEIEYKKLRCTHSRINIFTFISEL